MYGEPDPLYVRARAALLDTLDALEPHLDALVLVGAQAIYLNTDDADLAVAEYTTDADFSISPGELSDTPLLEDLLAARGFRPRDQPGRWLAPDGIYIDMMVPEALAGPGTRDARLGPHGKRAARRAKGLEGATVDMEDLARRLTALRVSDTAGSVTNEAIAVTPTLFGNPTAEGVLMAVRAAGDQEDPATISASLLALVRALLVEVGQ